MPFTRQKSQCLGIYVGLILAGMFMFLSICGCTVSSSVTVQPTISASGPATQNSEILYFPVMKSINIPGSGYSGIGAWQGKLIVEDGYIKLLSRITEEKGIVVWPSGFTLDISHTIAQILNKGQVIALVGDNVELEDGGDHSYDVIDVRTGQVLTDNSIINGPLWKAGFAEFLPFFPRYDDQLVKRNQFETTLSGLLVLDRGYLRIIKDTGESILPLWPSSYNVLKNFGLGGMENKGSFYVESGYAIYQKDRVTVYGTNLSDQEVQKYLKPDYYKDLEGPFWLVSTHD